jgi:AbiV family abortive infection protein
MGRDRHKTKKPIPSHAEAPPGSKLALQNARRHLRAANALGKMRLSGFASAHVVLAIEELAKAWILALYGMGLTFPPEMLTEILSRHSPRHAVAVGFLYVFMIQHVVARTTKRVQKRHGVKNYPPELRDEWVAELTREFKSLASRTPKNELVHAVMEWISQANDLKNSGLYVDFDGAKWAHPEQVRAKRFAFGYGMAKALIQRISREIRNLQQLSFHADSELNASLHEQLAKVQDASPKEMLRQLAIMALNPITARAGSAAP